jgi:hypothetical protein
MLVLLVGLCGGTVFFLSAAAPEAPIPNFTPDAAAASRFESKIAGASAGGGRFAIAITEAEASSWGNLNAESIQQADLPFENIQVRFRDNASTVYAEVDAFGLSNIGMEVGLSYTITVEGQVEVQVSSVNFGGVGMPESLKNDMSEQIQTIIDQQLQAISGNYRVTSLSSSNGVLSIQGQVRG